MHTGKITFLFDAYQGELYFTETWNLRAPNADEAMKQLRRLADARVGLLANNVRIAQLIVTGVPIQRPMLRGVAGTFASHHDKVFLRRDGYRTQHGLRGVA